MAETTTLRDVMRAPVSTLQHGLGASSAMSQRAVGGSGHPLENKFSGSLDAKRRERAIRASEIDVVYGPGAAMKFSADRAIMEKFHRHPGIESSFTGLRTLEGEDSKLSAADWLGDRENAPALLADFHATMEHKLKM